MKHLGGGQRFISRISALGFVADAEVEIVRSLSQRSIIVAVRGTQIALGYGEAAKVHVQVTTAEGKPAAPHGTLRVALAGQPNAGKTTVFNSLTGLAQHVGNWPGKTVEQMCGLHQSGNTTFQIVDLPGTYSLTSNSPEERIARDFIVLTSPDVVVMIADASALERNLYLLAELLVLPAPVVLGLNMMDVAEGQGIRSKPTSWRLPSDCPSYRWLRPGMRGCENLFGRSSTVARAGELYARYGRRSRAVTDSGAGASP